LSSPRADRSDEWDKHPQAARSKTAAVHHRADRDASAAPLGAAERPLSGVKVVDLTRIIAGPVCGRTLAAHGADVMLVTAPHLPSLFPLVVDTGRGKLSASLDLRQADAREALGALVRDADIFVQGYRPAPSPGMVSARRTSRAAPGIIYASLCAYSHEGPWANRRGFDSLVQTAGGLNAAEARRSARASRERCRPKNSTMHRLSARLRAMAALARRAKEGGSGNVRCSLAQTCHWFRHLGRIDGMTCPTRNSIRSAIILRTRIRLRPG